MKRFALALALGVAGLAVQAPSPARAGGIGHDEEPRQKSSLNAATLSGVGFDQRLGESIPLDATFRDEAGQTVQLSNYFGKKPVVLALVYNECPMLCSLVLSGLVGSVRAISTDVGKDFDVLVVSFDPKDKPEIARQKKDLYVRRYNRPSGEGGFHFLTGEPESIARLTRSVGFRYEYDARLGQFAHASGIVVLTQAGVIGRYLYGSEFAPKDLQFALAEASQGKVGSLATQLLMLCYRYDPEKGSYSATAMGALRVGGAGTVFLLGGFVAANLLRERRRRIAGTGPAGRAS